MSGDQLFDWREAEKDTAGGIDWTVPHSARVWDYWLGGKDYYEVDQEAGDKFLAGFAGIRDAVRQLRYFTARAVRYLAAEAGVRSSSTSAPACHSMTPSTRSPSASPATAASPTPTTTRWSWPSPGRCSPGRPAPSPTSTQT